jgi:hypothetical protein
VACSCKHDNEFLGSIKGGELIKLAEWLLAFQEELCSMELVNHCFLRCKSNKT